MRADQMRRSKAGPESRTNSVYSLRQGYGMTGVRTAHESLDINHHVITSWNQILPDAIRSLRPLHQEIVLYVMNLPGKRRPSGAYAAQVWRLSREDFFDELRYAFSEIQFYLELHGIKNSGDLTLE
jgi:hypothetical protein